MQQLLYSTFVLLYECDSLLHTCRCLLFLCLSRQQHLFLLLTYLLFILSLFYFVSFCLQQVEGPVLVHARDGEV